MSLRLQVSSFSRLIDEGKSITDVAVRFGITDTIVHRRLALARLSPVLWDAYDSADITLEALQAFTLTSDHETQERLWNDLPEWDRDKPNAIRRILLKEEIPANDKRVRFVGLDSYEAAGGLVRRDLLSEGEDGASIADPELLTRLVNNKLQTLATETSAQGWKWVNVQPQTDHQALGKFRRVQPTPVPLPKKDAAKLEKLEAKQSTLQDQLETEPESDEEANALYNQIEAVEKDIQAIHAKQTAIYDADTIAHCGAVVTIGHNGEPQLIYGLMTKEDVVQLAHTQDEAETEAMSEESIAGQPPSAYSAALVETLTTIKTAAIAAELSQQPHVALAGVVHALVLSQFGLDPHLYRSQSSIQINSTQSHLAEAAASPAVQALSKQKTAWLTRLPKTPNALWNWVLALPQDTLLSLLAFCAALSLNGIRTKNDSAPTRLHHADAVATALNMDMRNWFTPTADNFFSKVSKPHILEAMTEAGKAPNSNAPAKLKKGPLAELAEKTLAGTGWLPKPIRIAPAQPEDNSFANFDEKEEVNRKRKSNPIYPESWKS
jgi:ParB family chromosome partitioning protein